MSAQPQTTIPELAALIGLTVVGVTYHLRSLQKTGQLMRVGGRRAGRWEVVQVSGDEGVVV